MQFLRLRKLRIIQHAPGILSFFLDSFLLNPLPLRTFDDVLE